MKKQYLFLLLGLLFSLSTIAQNGNIQGSIIDEKGLPIPYGNVLIEALNKGAISDADGNFLLVNIPAGNQTIKVTYIGYADTETEAEVTEGKTTSLTITIMPKALELEGVIITGYNSGQAKALNAQKNKQNITNVVSTDQIGKFPDANIGDAVKRIPGITMQVDQGEARNIIVRGLAPQLNSVTLNGSRIPSAEGDNRNIQMDLIPSDMIQLIEVNKAVTPDMDADALGGSVNLVTRTSPNGFRVSATAGSGVNTITGKRIINGSFLIGDRTKNGKFGWMLSTSINDNDFGSDNIEAEWTDEFEYNTGEADDEGEAILEEVEVNPYANVFEQRTYLVQRIRRSFSANLDYAFNANNKIFLKTMYNWRDDRENRYRLEHEILDGEDIEIGDFTITDGVPTMFPVEVKRQTKGGIDNDRNKNTRLEDQRMQNYSLGGNHLFGKLEFDWLASYAKASEERLNERYIEYESEYVINNNSDSEFPLFTPANSSDSNIVDFELAEITEENQYTDEKDINAFVNFKLPVDLLNTGGGYLKFGGRLKLKEKQRDNNFFEVEPINDLIGVEFADKSNSNYLAGSQYAAGFFTTPEYLGQLDFTDTNLFDLSDIPDEYVRANYEVKENVYAAYAMVDQKLSDKLNVLVGLRLEGTKIEATGNEILDEEDVIGTITEEKDYLHVLPGVHFKYNVGDNTVLRLAWTNTLARPNYQDLVPSIDVVNDDEEIFLGNPDLSATTSMNFDLMAEHYFKSVGIISGGVFYKDISDFIYTFQFEDTATGYDAFQPQNGDDASILGAEFSFQRQLDFLPGVLKNLSLMANYTYLTSSADGIRNEDGDERIDLDLPGTAPHMLNGSLAYGGKKLNLRLSANFSDAYIDEIGGNAFEDRYYDEQFLLDFNASLALSDVLRVYFDLNNITDQPLRYYQGVKNRTMQAEYYGRRITFGLKYDLFKAKN